MNHSVQPGWLWHKAAAKAAMHRAREHCRDRSFCPLPLQMLLRPLLQVLPQLLVAVLAAALALTLQLGRMHGAALLQAAVVSASSRGWGCLGICALDVSHMLINAGRCGIVQLTLLQQMVTGCVGSAQLQQQGPCTLAWACYQHAAGPRLQHQIIHI